MININLTKNKLTKRSLGLVIMVGFAFMGIIACPSGGGGGGGGDTPTSGGTAMCTTTDDDTLAEVTNLAVTLMATSSSNGIVTLTWTDPTADGFTGVEITGGTPALASPIIVAKGTQTATIMGLTAGEESNFEVRSMYGTNCSDADGERRVAATPLFFEAVTNLTATPIPATGPNDAGGLTLTWTDPTADGFTGVEITGGTPALASPMMVAAGTQTATISGLTVGTASSYTVRSMYGENSSTGAMAMATPQGAIALFSLGKLQGNFGFAACQTAIDNAANTNLRSRGYTQARFFGSTPTYSYTAIHTDTDALGVTGTDISGYTIAAFTDSDLTATTAPTTTFGAPNAATRTLSNILTLSRNDLSSTTRAVIATVIMGTLTDANPMWTMTDSTSSPVGSYAAGFNCSGATSNSADNLGITAGANNIGGASFCHGTHHVLCVAR